MSGAGDVRAGEGALLVPEQLGVDQVLGQRGAIHADEGLAFARAELHDGVGHQFFAGAALAANDHGGIAGGDAIDSVVHPAHGLAAADHLAQRIFADQLLAQAAAFDLQAALLQRPLQHQAQLVEVHRRGEEFVGADLAGHQPHAAAGGAGEGHQNGIAAQGAQLAQDRKAVFGGGAGGIQIEQDGIQRQLSPQRQDLVGRSQHGGVEGGSEELFHVGQGGFVSSDDSNAPNLSVANDSCTGHKSEETIMANF